MTKDEAEKAIEFFPIDLLPAMPVINPFDGGEWLIAVKTPTGVKLLSTPLQAEWFLHGYQATKRARL